MMTPAFPIEWSVLSEESTRSAGGQLEQPSDVNNSTTTGLVPLFAITVVRGTLSDCALAMLVIHGMPPVNAFAANIITAPAAAIPAILFIWVTSQTSTGSKDKPETPISSMRLRMV